MVIRLRQNDHEPDMLKLRHIKVSASRAVRERLRILILGTVRVGVQ